MSKWESKSDDSNEVTTEDILSWIHSIVWTGDYDAEEVAIIIEDQLEDLLEEEDIDRKWLAKAIRQEFTKKRKAEKTWPKETDCDRLDRVFEALEKRGYIALQIAGFTQSDSMEEVEDAYKEAGGKKSNYAGHCSFTEQDQEGALEGGGLYIGYGHLSGNNKKGVEVGRVVSEELAKEGFKVKWNGTIDQRLFVKGFNWQRRSPK
jgi:hypothetical protein